MNAITIHDLRESIGGRVLSFDLVDILRLAEADVRASSWRCRHVECVGDLAEDLHRAADAGNPVTGTELLRLASGIRQVIDGDFEGFRPAATTPWVVIRAVDSSEYVVVTDDKALLSRLRERFHNVSDSPGDATDCE